MNDGAIVVLVSGGLFFNFVILAFWALLLQTAHEEPLILKRPLRIALGVLAFVPWLYVTVLVLAMAGLAAFLLGVLVYCLLAGKDITKLSS